MSNLHPYHSYALLFDKEMDTMVHKLLENEITNLKHFLKQVEDKIKDKNNKQSLESLLFEKGVFEKLITESENNLYTWSNKCVVRITKEEEERIFGTLCIENDSNGKAVPVYRKAQETH